MHFTRIIYACHLRRVIFQAVKNIFAVSQVPFSSNKYSQKEQTLGLDMPPFQLQKQNCCNVHVSTYKCVLCCDNTLRLYSWTVTAVVQRYSRFALSFSDCSSRTVLSLITLKISQSCQAINASVSSYLVICILTAEAPQTVSFIKNRSFTKQAANNK